MKIINQLIKYGFYLFAFLLPWQTRWIYKEAELNGGTWEYGRMSLYGTEILLIILLSLGLINWFIQYKKKTNEQKLEEVKSELKGQKLLIILLIIWSGLTIFWSANKLLAWSGWLNLLWGIGIFWLIKSQKIAIKKVGYALISSGVVQSLLGVWQFFTQRVFASKWLGLAAHRSSDLGANVIEADGERWLRAYGSWGGANPLGIYLAVLLVLGLILYLREEDHKVKFLITVGQLIILSGLLVSFSRGAWLAALAGVAVVWVVVLKKENFKNNFFKQIFFSVLLVLLFFAAFKPLVSTRFDSDARLESLSVLTRENQIKEAINIWRSHPFFGIGAGNYTLVLYQKNPNLAAGDYQPVHNIYLLLLAELGIIGVLVFLIFIVVFIQGVYQNNLLFLPIIIALLVGGLFEHFLWSLPNGIMLWWLVLGLMRSEKI